MSKSKIHIGLDNPKSPSNVDVVMRAADCYDVSSVLYTGERYVRAAQFNSDKRDARKKIPLSGVESLLDSRPKGARVVCVDLIVGASSLPEFQHPESAFYIFGPEDGTIAQSIIDQADDVVYIPTKHCMNLAATVNVLLYDRMAKSDLSFAGNAHIRKIRDANNKTTIRGSDPF